MQEAEHTYESEVNWIVFCGSAAVEAHRVWVLEHPCHGLGARDMVGRGGRTHKLTNAVRALSDGIVHEGCRNDF